MLYIGKGFVPGFPARDLTAAEVERLGGVETVMRAAPGLYAKPAAPKSKPERSARRAPASKPKESLS